MLKETYYSLAPRVFGIIMIWLQSYP